MRYLKHRKANVIFLKILFAFLILFFKGEDSYSYERIVSLAPSVTESLYLLGLKDKIVGISIYCPDPYNIKKIGTTLEPNIEEIVSLAPDLVLACYEANSERSIEKLKSLGLNIFVIRESRNFSDICSNFLNLGKVVGREGLAYQIVEDAKKRLNDIWQKNKRIKPVKVFWQIGAHPLITVNKESFINEIIEFSGGENIFSDLA
jgi:iron complex transport system substrate-binding protein